MSSIKVTYRIHIHTKYQLLILPKTIISIPRRPEDLRNWTTHVQTWLARQQTDLEDEQCEKRDAALQREPGDHTTRDQGDHQDLKSDDDGEAEAQPGRQRDAKVFIIRSLAVSYITNYNLLDLEDESETAADLEESNGVDTNLEDEDDFLIPMR